MLVRALDAHGRGARAHTHSALAYNPLSTCVHLFLSGCWRCLLWTRQISHECAGPGLLFMAAGVTATRCHTLFTVIQGKKKRKKKEEEEAPPRAHKRAHACATHARSACRCAGTRLPEGGGVFVCVYTCRGPGEIHVRSKVAFMPISG